ncbi:MAG: hypothetical protein K6C14_06850, partial [Eubacterium sp.]|nr:hypothetical protein [Eubacterium sp.]
SNYIYAACTLKSCRGKGIMSALLEYAKKEYPSLCLIPASDSLAEYYGKRGLNIEIPIESISFNESEELCEYLFEGYSLSKPTALMYKGD